MICEDLPSDEYDDNPEPPPFDSVPLLPVEIGLYYTYPEVFGEAEVTYLLPAGYPYILVSGEEILNDDLEPGMRILLKDGAVATITHVELSYEPPDPPERGEDGRMLSRVVGTIKHKGFSTVDVSWPGNTAKSSPDHPYYSVSRGGYVGARKLKVGEFLRTDDSLLTPVLSVTKAKFGMIDLYNVEVEHFHNYYVGESGGSAVLVHNSTTPNYINTPAQGTGKKPKYEPSQYDATGKIFPFKKSSTLDLTGESVGFAKDSYVKGTGFAYVLRDKNTGEILKVGKTTGGVNIYERFNRYRRKSQEYGHNVEVEFWDVGKNADAKAIERQLRSTLKGQGERLPWDGAANPGRNDLGLPWERRGGTQLSIE